MPDYLDPKLESFDGLVGCIVYVDILYIYIKVYRYLYTYIVRDAVCYGFCECMYHVCVSVCMLRCCRLCFEVVLHSTES